ncbi:galactose-specific lectin nattectin-like [Corythoichthys intestinalis]|uniref:galactose-specific lectin nattectin-like n=1 Tax=Corythoichthys intestinalis TaxID=161448 RepID=UPI0025A5E9DB|nr:galactose-specific lectin nattectin-like [Corythoichthys intestinalis]XP_057692858.1 galactose-specific lectin nattectin-like [Corythoichthys intestinalis]XP_057692859.1 galactose-specific lectin nattectin-like [Corythoichthys intestinalis]
MALALRSLFLLCGLTGLLTGVGSFPSRFFNDVSCPEGWTQVDLKCYILEDDARMFQDAEAVCNILGGNMVSISNDLENIVVGAIGENGVSGATMWIGLFDNIKEGTYFWTDGTNNDFSSFRTGEPNSAVGDCVEIETSTGEWATVPCTTEHRFVCNRDAGH